MPTVDGADSRSPAEMLARAVSELTSCANAKQAALTADMHAADAIVDADAQLNVAMKSKHDAVERKEKTAAGIGEAKERGRVAGEHVKAAVTEFVNANFGD